jgi:hypothetical protein
MGDPLAGPQAPEDADLLLHDLSPIPTLHSHGVELVAERPEPDPHGEPAGPCEGIE